MKEIKIFLAHTSEVKEDVEKIQSLIYKKYQKNKEINIIIEHWKDADKSLSQERFQQRLNELLGTCEILYIFFQNRIGEYTKEEFYYGLDRFKENQKPYSMSIFFKNFNLDDDASDEEWTNATINRKFKKEIQELNGNQYTFPYKNIDDLENKLLAQLKIDIEKPIPSPEELPIELQNILPKKEEIKIYLKENMQIQRRDINFVGREVEIKYILKILFNKRQCAITGVIGNGGVGKSAIANEIIHIIKDSWRGKYSDYLKEKAFVDGVLWIKLEKEQTLALVYEEQIKKQLGVSFGKDKFENELHKILSDRDILIVLDSAEQNEDIFNELMTTFRSFPILITSRQNHPDVMPIPLDTLDENESFELFQNHLGREISKEEKKSIIGFCIKTLGGLPLAIKIIANYMKIYRRKLDEINKDLLDIEMKDNFREETLSINSIFKLSFDKLTPQAQKVFAIGSVFIYPFKEEYLLEVAKATDAISIEQELNRLIEINLLDRDKEGLYSYHPLIREYALKKLYAFEISESIFEAQKEYYASLSANESNLFDIYDELIYILKDDYKKENYQRFFRIVKNLDWWLMGIGFYTRREELVSRGYEKAKELEEKENEYYFLRSYADTLHRKGNNKDSEIYLKKALAFEEAKDDFYLHYSLFAKDYYSGNYKKSYVKNLEFLRKTLIKGQTNLFFRTNSWICSDFSKLNLSLNYSKIYSFTEDSKSNNFMGLIDLIKIFFYQTSYKKSLNYINILENYIDDENLWLSDKLILKVCRCWIYLYTKDTYLIQEIESIKNSFNLLKFGSGFDNLRKIEGLYHIDNQNFDMAKESFLKILYEEEREYNLGVYYSYTDIGKAKEIFENLLQKEKLSPKTIANIKLYLSYIYAKKEQKEQAIKLLCEAQNIFGEYMNPIYKKVEKEILESVGVDEYIKEKSNIEIEKIDDKFFLEDLPQSLIAKDNKEMVLIPQGFSIYGEDNFSIPTTDEIFENIDMILNNDEKLQSIRYLGNFYIDREAVTNGEYIEYCKKAEIEIHKELEEKDSSLPITDLTLEEMQKYAEFYDKELPLPEEWEKACRGEENFNYPWGNNWEDENINIEVDETMASEVKKHFINHETYEEYFEWFVEYCNVDLSIISNSKDIDVVANNEENFPMIKSKLPTNVNINPYISLDKVTINVSTQNKNIVSNNIEPIEIKKVQEQKTEEFTEIYQSKIEHQVLIEKDNKSLTIIKSINLPTDVKIDTYYFMKLLLNSFSLTVDEKNRIIQALPTLTESQIHDLIRILSEEVYKFGTLDKKHSEQLNELLNKHRNGIFDLISDENNNLKIEQNMLTEFEKYFVNHKTYEEYFDWFVEYLKIEKTKKIIIQDVKEIPNADISDEEKRNIEKSQKEFERIYTNIKPKVLIEKDDKSLAMIKSINLPTDVKIDTYYFMKLLLNSLSLTVDEKNRIIQALPKLTESQIHDLIRILSEEVYKFGVLDKKHNNQLNELLKKHQNGILSLMIKDIPNHISSISPYGVKDMVGNGYEMTVRNEEEILKSSEIDYDFKENLKGKIEQKRNNLMEQSSKTPIFDSKPQKTKIAFRCVKPIFKIEDLKELQNG